MISSGQPGFFQGIQSELSVVSAGCGIAAVAGPVGMEELSAVSVQPLIGVRAEIIALRL